MSGTEYAMLMSIDFCEICNNSVTLHLRQAAPTFSIHQVNQNPDKFQNDGYHNLVKLRIKGNLLIKGVLKV
jgi:hypothetical protein